jgi:uncharacterized protein
MTPARVAAILLAMALPVAAQEPAGGGVGATVTVGTATAARGEKAFGAIEVPAGSDASMSIPVAVVHGSQPGPVLALISGAHGTEYASILAVVRLIQALQPDAVRGTVILVPLVNPPSFHRIVPHLNPVDGKNMNRRYPGGPDGTQSDRASDRIVHEVVARADYLVDFHGGDLDESLYPFAYWPRTGREAQDAVSRGMVLAFGIDHIVLSTARPPDATGATSLSGIASFRGIPSIIVEAGHAGTTEPADIGVLVDGTLSVMRHLGMLEGASSAIEHPVWIERIVSVASETDGIFSPLVRRGQMVEAGMKLGYVTDYFGRPVAEARAPVAGVILFVRAVPSMSKGETIAYVGPLAR